MTKPEITSVLPRFALPGGEVQVTGRSLVPEGMGRPKVLFGEEEATVMMGSSSKLIAQVPSDSNGAMVVSVGDEDVTWEVGIAQMVAENLHPVANPAVDRDGNIFVTFSGSRGQNVPVAIFKIDEEFNVAPFVNEMMNPTGLALDSEGYLYVSSRFDGNVYQVDPSGKVSTYAEGMGVATGIAFDHERNLYVGDRSGTIFKIASDRQIYVFATLEPSMAAYHLAFSPNGNLYVTAPSTSSNDAIYEVDPHGSVSVFYRGLGRPQGLAFDFDGNLYVASSLKGNRGIVKVTPEREASLMISGNDLVGLAFAPEGNLVLATNSEILVLQWGVDGRVLVAD